MSTVPDHRPSGSSQYLHGPLPGPIATAPIAVARYCTMHDIHDACRATADLAHDQLPLGSSVSFSLEADGESEEQSLIVHLGIKTSPEEVFGIFDRFVDAWIDRVPTRAQHWMGLTYSAL